MTRPAGEQPEYDDARKFLPAFADGELDVERSLRVLEQMAMDPQATRRVMHQQQLRQAVARAMTSPAAPAPEALREQVLRLAERRPTAPDAATAGDGVIRGRWFRLVPLAAAAGLLIVLGVALDRTLVRPAAPHGAAGALPAQLVADVTRTHVSCSAWAAHRDATLLPERLVELPPALEAYLGKALPQPAVPDLSGIGFTFSGAEPCPVPGGKSVHLLYHGTGEKAHDALSLFVQVDNGQLAIPPGRLHSAAGPDKAHPMFVWRAHGLVYYVVGNGFPAVSKAAQIAGAPGDDGLNPTGTS